MEQSTEFHRGLRRERDDDMLLAQLLSQELRLAGSFAIFENGIARRGDAFLRRLKSKITYVDDTVLHVVPAGATADDIRTTLIEAKSLPTFIGIWGHDESSSSWGDLNRLVMAARGVVVGAYDGESYVVMTQDK